MIVMYVLDILRSSRRCEAIAQPGVGAGGAGGPRGRYEAKRRG